MPVLSILCLLFAAGFLGLTAYVVAVVGFIECFVGLASTPAGILAMVDLGLMVGCGLYLLVVDARRQGINPVPYVCLTLATGSTGPLLYLARRWR